jgi:peptide/nickel transport system permease protein
MIKEETTYKQLPSQHKNNLRKKTIFLIVFALVILLSASIAGIFIKPDNLTTDFISKNLAPNFAHPFGTDWLGRDMFLRTIKGLSLSIFIGMFACAIGIVIAVILGLMSATMGKKVDAVICFLIDLFLSTPHILMIIIICFAVGGGLKGVIIGIAVTHWASLARLVRAEVKQLLAQEYVHIARQLGKSRFYIAVHHIFPPLLPLLLVGFISTFPHALLHEASITFLGFGLPPHEPAIGIILSESMKYLAAGYWWLAALPGLSLLFIVLLFDVLGENIKKLIHPKMIHS